MPTIHYAELEMEDYSIHRHDRPTTIGDGVLIAVYKSVNSTEADITADNAELLRVKVVMKNLNFS